MKHFSECITIVEQHMTLICDSICRKCPKLVNLQRQGVDYWFPRGGMGHGITANEYRLLFGRIKVFQN